ncbi:MAG: hypothetical protein ACREX3_23495, partial [Gammaproteobacteria bacterium]
MRTLKITVGLALGALLGAAVSFAGGSLLGGDSDVRDASSFVRPVGQMSSAEVAAFGDFPVYGLQKELDDLSLSRAK